MYFLTGSTCLCVSIGLVSVCMCCIYFICFDVLMEGVEWKVDIECLLHLDIGYNSHLGSFRKLHLHKRSFHSSKETRHAGLPAGSWKEPTLWSLAPLGR